MSLWLRDKWCVTSTLQVPKWNFKFGSRILWSDGIFVLSSFRITEMHCFMFFTLGGTWKSTQNLSRKTWRQDTFLDTKNGIFVLSSFRITEMNCFMFFTLGGTWKSTQNLSRKTWRQDTFLDTKNGIFVLSSFRITEKHCFMFFTLGGTWKGAQNLSRKTWRQDTFLDTKSHYGNKPYENRMRRFLQTVFIQFSVSQTSGNRGPLHTWTMHTRTTFVKCPAPKSAFKWIEETLPRWLKLP
jgi:hypothetical protein